MLYNLTPSSILKSFAKVTLGLLIVVAPSQADTGSKLLGTGGITSFEGSAGGGISPWALIAGYASKEEIAATANIQNLSAGEYKLNSYGFAVGAYDTFEFSLQKQSLDVSSGVVSNVFNLLTGAPTPALVAPSTQIEQSIVGLKYNLYGDAIFSESPYLPQIAIGIQYKKNHDFNQSLALHDGSVPIPKTGVPALLGAKDSSGTDFYVSATKVWLGALKGNNLLLNATARYTKANTFGLLGFGSQTDDSYDLEWAASIAMFSGTNTIIGAEYRQQTNRLGGLAKTDNVTDFFITYLPSKEWSITAAIVDLGNLPFQPDSSGFYLSITANL